MGSLAQTIQQRIRKYNDMLEMQIPLDELQTDLLKLYSESTLKEANIGLAQQMSKNHLALVEAGFLVANTEMTVPDPPRPGVALKTAEEVHNLVSAGVLSSSFESNFKNNAQFFTEIFVEFSELLLTVNKLRQLLRSTDVLRQVAQGPVDAETVSSIKTHVDSLHLQSKAPDYYLGLTRPLSLLGAAYVDNDLLSCLRRFYLLETKVNELCKHLRDLSQLGD